MLQYEIKERNRKAIEEIKLTDEELEAAIFEGKRKKFFLERSGTYYQDQENEKITQTKLSSQS